MTSTDQNDDQSQPWMNSDAGPTPQSDMGVPAPSGDQVPDVNASPTPYGIPASSNSVAPGGQESTPQNAMDISGATSVPQQQGPPQVARYLSGADAAPRQVVQALEKQVDPQNTMDQNERTLRTIDAAAQDSPDVANGVMQYYKANYRSYSAATAAALAKGANPEVVAKNFNAAQSYVPDGNRVTMAPSKSGGYAVQVHTLGGESQTYDVSPEQLNQFVHPGSKEGAWDNLIRPDTPDQVNQVMQQLQGSAGRDIENLKAAGATKQMPATGAQPYNNPDMATPGQGSGGQPYVSPGGTPIPQTEGAFGGPPPAGEAPLGANVTVAPPPAPPPAPPVEPWPAPVGEEAFAGNVPDQPQGVQRLNPFNPNNVPVIATTTPGRATYHNIKNPGKNGGETAIRDYEPSTTTFRPIQQPTAQIQRNQGPAPDFHGGVPQSNVNTTARAPSDTPESRELRNTSTNNRILAERYDQTVSQLQRDLIKQVNPATGQNWTPDDAMKAAVKSVQSRGMQRPTNTPAAAAPANVQDNGQQPAAPGGRRAISPNQRGAEQLPANVVDSLEEGMGTKLANGQVWTLKNGQPVQVQ